MPYATASAVMARTRGRTFTASSKPNLSDLDTFLVDTAVELDGILRARGYTVPIPTTATSAHALIAGYNVTGAVAFVEQAAPSAGNTGKDALKLWQDCKRMLRAGEIELDTAQDADQALPRHGAVATSRFATLLEDGC